MDFSMFRFKMRLLVLTGVACAVLVFSHSESAAQTSRGFKSVVESTATPQEFQLQDNPWTMEVHLKPMRMIQVDITDPVTKKTQRELIWYLVYRAN